MPPRHGKSRLVGESAIPWFLEEFPERHVILISYNGDKAQEWGRKARDTIKNRRDLFSVNVRDDMARVDRFETDAGSEAHFLGINGGVTGKGGHLVIIDDYIKDITEALSPAFRERQWMQFLANLDTRLEPGATVIIVATRWHSDDLIGRVTRVMDDWEVISLPAIAMPGDALGRKEGEPLFPERYDVKRLDQIRRARAGTYLWEAMYQQQPFGQALGLTDPFRLNPLEVAQTAAQMARSAVNVARAVREVPQIMTKAEARAVVLATGDVDAVTETENLNTAEYLDIPPQFPSPPPEGDESAEELIEGAGAFIDDSNSGRTADDSGERT